MKKIPFNQLPIYKAIRNSKLSRRIQDEVLRKLIKYYKKYPNDGELDFSGEASLLKCLNWKVSKEGYKYWRQMHCDSGL